MPCFLEGRVSPTVWTPQTTLRREEINQWMWCRFEVDSHWSCFNIHMNFPNRIFIIVNKTFQVISYSLQTVLYSFSLKNKLLRLKKNKERKKRLFIPVTQKTHMAEKRQIRSVRKVSLYGRSEFFWKHCFALPREHSRQVYVNRGTRTFSFLSLSLSIDIQWWGMSQSIPHRQKGSDKMNEREKSRDRERGRQAEKEKEEKEEE